MIYISSSYTRAKTIRESVETLAGIGFKNIELSGGTDYYTNLENDLLELQTKYGLSFICHNYFPPPREPIVLNLASLNGEIFERSLFHYKNAIELSHRLGASVFGIHAGFLIDFQVSEIGKKLNHYKCFNREEAIEQFCKGYSVLTSIARDLGVELYLENNVFSQDNFAIYSGGNPFLMTHYDEFEFLSKLIKINLLLDVGHLKVSTTTLKLNFEDELEKMMSYAKYLHFSDNDSLHDQNQAIKKESNLWQILSRYNLKQKTITLEIYDSLDKVKQSHSLLNSIM
ncbi:MAG: sugar phosphate isomerase/epimerase [Candidatus Brocadiaceae bacterium]|nr:sugar phosphate isomerase/epimerase [Candidatus Brocadiaceae bacterium]